MSRNRGYVYMLVSADEFEIPIMLANSLAELSKMSGIPVKTLVSARARGSKCHGKYFIRRINADLSTASIHVKNQKLQKLKAINSESKSPSTFAKNKKDLNVKKKNKMEKQK